MAASEADSLAMAANLVYGLPSSLSAAALYVSRRACSIRTCMSAILLWIICSLAIGMPKAWIGKRERERQV